MGKTIERQLDPGSRHSLNSASRSPDSLPTDREDSSYISPIESQLDWRGVRPEYYKVWADFELTAIPFGIQLTACQRNAIGEMLLAMDLIDSAIDRVSIRNVRDELCESILNWMRNTVHPFPLHEHLETKRLLRLRKIICDQDIVEPFLGSAARVFRASEGKRNAVSSARMIQFLIDEGQAAADMTIAIVGANTNDRFSDFLQRIMRIGTIVDSLLDAGEDFRSGILQLNPNWRFRWKLKWAIGRQLPGLILRFPDRKLLWRYCLSYTRDDVQPLA